MTFLALINRGSLNRKFLELIGLTTKGHLLADTSVIGYKGSGTKLAAIAALRLGLRVAISSTDYLGRYFLSFDWEEVDIGGPTAKQVFFRYRTERPDGTVEDLRFPTNMTVDAFPDWDKPVGCDPERAFKVFREFVCNAQDADPSYRVEFVEQPVFAKDGETAVFIEFDARIHALVTRSERYLKFFTRKIAVPRSEHACVPLVSVPGAGEIYPKTETDVTRLFVLGVLVECTKDPWRSSLFDYSLSDKSLVSEDRTIAEHWRYMSGLGRLFASITDADIATRILKGAVSSGAIEQSGLGYADSLGDSSRVAWTEAVRRTFGERLCIASGNELVDKDAAQIFGYRPVSSTGTAIGRLLARLGVPEASSVVPAGVEIKYELVRYADLEAASRARFDEAFRLFARHFPGRATLPVIFYEPRDERMKRWAGFCGLGDRKYSEIWISSGEGHTLGSVQDLFETLSHESRHCETRTDDYDRAFVRAAEKDLSTVVLRLAGHAAYGDGTPLPEEGDPDAAPNLQESDAPSDAVPETVPLPEFDDWFKPK